MPIADTVNEYLVDRDIDYHVFPHAYAESAEESARAAHVEPARMAKAVVFATNDDRRRKYRMAVLPANHDIDVFELGHFIRQRIELAKECELILLFPDCAIGAVPILGEAYGLPTIVDESLKKRTEYIFFEAGDHEELIRVSAGQFRRLMADAEFASFSHSNADYMTELH